MSVARTTSSKIYSYCWRPALQYHTGVRRRNIVTQIGPTTSLLRSDNTDNEVYLLGTAHISEASANEAIQLISVVQPQKVFIELDPPRAARLRASEYQNEDQFENAMNEAAKIFAKQGIVPPHLAGFGSNSSSNNIFQEYIASFYKMLRGYGYVPGVEMLAAMKEADRIGAQLVYGDRDVNDTLREIKSAFSSLQLMQVMTAGLPPPEIQSIMMDMANGGIESLGDNVELLKTRENARALSTYMTTVVPDVANVLIHRRDKTMAMNLHKYCGERKVVAVVGLAHVDGIEREWQAIENTRTKQPKLGS